jgi:hypothetical protein
MPPWPKGVSGNPGERPKRKPIFEALQRNLRDADLEPWFERCSRNCGAAICSLSALPAIRWMASQFEPWSSAGPNGGPIDIISRMLENNRRLDRQEDQ